MVSRNDEAGYGTIQGSPGSDTSPTTVNQESRGSLLERLRFRSSLEIEPQWTHLVLIILFFITGLVDSAAYNIWSCFVSMQTGMYSTGFVAPKKYVLSKMISRSRFAHFLDLILTCHQVTLSSSAWASPINPSPPHRLHG